MTDRLHIRGVVTLRIYRCGVLRAEERLQNLVTTAGRDALTRALAGDASGLIADVGFGDGAAAPDLADGDLENARIWRPVDGLTAPGGATLHVAWSLPLGQLTTGTVVELGLRAADGTLVARRVRSVPIPLDDDVSLEGEWDLQLLGV